MLIMLIMLIMLMSDGLSSEHAALFECRTDLRGGLAGMIDLNGIPVGSAGGGDVVLQIIEEDDLLTRETDRIFECPVDGRLRLVKAEQMRGMVHVE